MIDAVSYEEAADILGCDHHWVRMLTSRGVFSIIDRVEVKPNVLKVYISRDEVLAYKEAHRKRNRVTMRLTAREEQEVESLLRRLRR